MDQRPVFPPRPRPRGPYPVLALLSEGYPRVRGRLLTCYAPVRHCTQRPKSPFSSDLHVLSTPPAFVLSQDQTLRTNQVQPQGYACTTLHCIQGLSRRRYESLLRLSKNYYQKEHDNTYTSFNPAQPSLGERASLCGYYCEASNCRDNEYTSHIGFCQTRAGVYLRYV
jgi:hypothetical protein